MVSKVIFHIDEPARWPLLLRNVINLLASYETAPPLVRVLANAEAVRGYVQQEGRNTMETLAAEGVQFSACRHALAGAHLPEDRLPAFVMIVPVGMRELVDRQLQGYAYIKP